MWFKKKPRLIQDQIRVFVADRIRHGDVAPSYTYWLQQFSMWYKVNDANDITDEDEVRFLQDVSVLYPTHYQMKCAKTAIENLRRYYHARERNLEKSRLVEYTQPLQMKAVEKTERNREIYGKRIENPKYWSLRRLGKEYKLHWTRVAEIIEETSRKINV